MKLKNKIKEIMGSDEKLIEKFLSYTVVGNFFLLMEEAVHVIGDKKLIKEFDKINELILERRKELGETEIQKKDSEEEA